MARDGIDPALIDPGLIDPALSARLDAAQAALDAALSEARTLIGLLAEPRGDAGAFDAMARRPLDNLEAARSHILATRDLLPALVLGLTRDGAYVGPLDKPEDDRRRGGHRAQPGPRPTLVTK